MLSTLLFVLTAYSTAWAQEDKPITKANLLSSLRLGKQQRKSAEVYVELIKQHGVDFRMTDEDEQEIRQAGVYLGTKGLTEVIAAVRANDRSERLRVSLFKYDPCDQYFDQFVAVIRSKISDLSGRFVFKGGQYRYIARLYLAREEKPFNMNLEEENRYWEDTRSLQILEGMCTIQGKDVYVLSQVFLGSLHGSLKSPIRVEFKIDPEEFGDTKDIHSVLILYSLAQEARARGQSKDVIISYLSEALGILAQIKHSNPTTLQPVKNAIEDMLRELGASNLLILPAP